MKLDTFFSTFSNFVSKWLGSHWALFVATVVVSVSLFLFGLDATNIGISIATLLMLFVLQNTQNRDSAALHLKLDDLVKHIEGPRDEVIGVESKSDEEIEELRDKDEI